MVGLAKRTFPCLCGEARVPFEGFVRCEVSLESRIQCWKTADTTQRAVLLMANISRMRNVELVRGAGGAGGIFGFVDIGCVLDTFYLHRTHNVPYSGYFLLFLKFTALYTFYSSLEFPPLHTLPRTQLSPPEEHTPSPTTTQVCSTHTQPRAGTN